MSVTNRKMFNRAARNKVRQMGGIMASSEPLIQEVARFQNGGGVTQSTIDFLNKYVNPLDARGRIKALEYLRENAPSVMSPIDKYVNPFDTKTGNLKALQYLYEKTLPDSVTDKAEGVGAFPRTSEVLKNIQLREPTDKVQGQTGAITGKALQSAIDVGTLAASGIGDFLLEGMGANRLGSAQISGNDLRNMFEGKTPMRDLDGKPMTQREFQAQVANSMQLSNDEKRAMFGMTDEYLAQGDEELDKITEALTPEALKKQEEDRKKAETIAMREAEKKTAVEGGMPDSAQTVTEEGVKDLQDQISGGRISSGAEQTLGVTADQGTEAKLNAESKKVLEGEGDINNVKGQVTESFKTGVGVKGAIKQFIDEFVSNAPEYKGMDKGLAIAKIGFAMAAGESPNAITNIAKALSDGADMFIEDNAKRDAFNRQVQLSALQYGVGEVGKQRAQARADARNFKTYVVGKGGYTDKNGKVYKEDEMVELSMADILKDGGKMKNLSSLTAINERRKFQLDEMELLIKQAELRNELAGGGVDPANYGDIVSEAEKYGKAMSIAEDSTRAIAMFDGVLKTLDDPELEFFSRGLFGGIGTTIDKTAVFFGVEVDKKFKTQKAIEDQMLQALPEITRVALGSTQSANSISDRDVLLQIIRPYFGGLIQEDENGMFSLNLVSKERVEAKINGAINKLLASQVQSLQEADAIYNRLSGVKRVKSTDRTGLQMIGTDLPRRAVFDLSAGSRGVVPTFDIIDKDGKTTLQLVTQGQS